MVNLRSGHWRQPVASDYIRRITAVDPDDEPPERFMNATFEIFDGDLTVRQMWIDWLAIGLIGTRLRDAALVLEGPGRNGKSMLEDLVVAYLGNVLRGGYALKTARPDAFDVRRNRGAHAESLGMMDGARMVMFSETPGEFEPDEALLKSAIAGETTEASFKYKTAFQFRFAGSLTFATNVPIHFTSGIPALRNRFHTIALHRRFDDDRDFYNQLLAEAPRVLGMLIQRCTDILQGAETFWLPKSWGPSQQAFIEIGGASNQRFDLIDPIGAIVRRLVESKANSRIGAADLLERVRLALLRMQENAEEGFGAVDAALALTDRSLQMRIGSAMRSEFGRCRVRVGEDRLQGFTGVDFTTHPRLPFSD